MPISFPYRDEATRQAMSHTRVAETLESLRCKDPRSTTLERICLTAQVWEGHRDEPQPLQLAGTLEDLLDRIELPLQPHDLILGRIREDIPDAVGEAHFQEAMAQLGGARPPCMTDNGHETFDWERLLELGLCGLRAEAEAQLATRQANGAPQEVRDFLAGAARILGAYQNYAQRYAATARDAGMPEQATVADAVATRAPSTFHEAVQLMWFVGHVYSTMASQNPTLTFGRMDQWLYLFYERDLRDGRLTREQAGDIIEDFYCKNNLILGRGEHQMDGGSGKATGWSRNLSYDSPQYIVIGGGRHPRRPDPSDLTNLFLERIVPRFENPYVVLRYWREIPPDTWALACRKLRDNASMMIYSDDCVVPAMERLGIPRAEALEYTMHGCNWPDLPPSQVNMGCIWRNVAATLTAALPRLEAIAAGMDDVYAAFRERYSEEIRADIAHTVTRREALSAAAPGTLALDDCFLRGPIASACAKRSGGVRYRTMLTTFSGFATLADSLAAIDDVVFRQHAATLDELVDALEADFVGYEQLHSLCRRAPKWGCNDERADAHAVRIMKLMQEEIDAACANVEGKPLLIFRCIETDMTHIRAGRETGATPDGRRAGAPISENTSPAVGASRDGITSMLQSVAKLPLDTCHSGALNVRLQPQLFAGPDGERRLGQLLRTYFDQGGMQVQLSMIDNETLRAAQACPEQHRDLMVRVTGYSAAFVDMSAAAQNEIIRREEMAV